MQRRTTVSNSLCVLDWLIRTLRSAGDGMAEARRRHQAYEELVALNNLELEDIGISRGNIPAVVAGTLRREQTSTASDLLPITRREGPRPPGVATRLRGRRSKQMCIPTEDEDAAENEVDIRSLASAQRHAKIIELVNELAPGACFILVNDHDPKPLYYQLEAEYPKQLSWTYLERGPGAWRIEIGKFAQAA
ncbi:MAG: DUF2249 domain-containing protein [Bradyrhizobium sp.]|jgi:uncharacterized protein (DUF2249 family)/uncharacterized protein YjiS (DUF1127 family)